MTSHCDDEVKLSDDDVTLLFVSGCGDCQVSLGNDSRRLLDRLSVYWNQTRDVFDIQGQDNRLQAVQAAVDSTYSRLLRLPTNQSTSQRVELTSLQATLQALLRRESFYQTSLLTTDYIVCISSLTSSTLFTVHTLYTHCVYNVCTVLYIVCSACPFTYIVCTLCVHFVDQHRTCNIRVSVNI